jgi:nitroimidazol reductase NimA-like FMN-containing flavoprotein (pyridoxamine 5'-phosphate oxidase superfamily)
MDATDDWSTGRLVELAEDECWDLLRSTPAGRLAWSGAEGLSVVPVNFVAAERRIVIKTAAYSAQARECDDNPVAFQVDALDASTRSGWSVLVRGVAHIDYGRDQDRDLPDVWPAGVRPLKLVVEPTSVTGRRLLAS